MRKVVTVFVFNVVVLAAVAFLAVAPGSAYACPGAFSGGPGTTPSTAYLISTQGDLEALARETDCHVGVYFRQTNDIDLTGGTWAPIGSESSPFEGFYDGGGHRITGLTVGVVTEDYTGLFRLCRLCADSRFDDRRSITRGWPNQVFHHRGSCWMGD